MSDVDLDDFNEIFDGLHVSLQSKVNSMLTNFKLPKDRFSDIYSTMLYNISKDRADNNTIPIEVEVIQRIEEKLMSEGQQQKKKSVAPPAGAQSQRMAKKSQGPAMAGLDVFASLAAEKKARKEEKLAKSPQQIASKMVTNSKTKINPVSYHQR